MLGTIRKAIAAFIGALIAWATVVISAHDGDFPIGDISAYEWLALATVVATFLATYGITNDPAKLHPEDV